MDILKDMKSIQDRLYYFKAASEWQHADAEKIDVEEEKIREEASKKKKGGKKKK